LGEGDIDEAESVISSVAIDILTLAHLEDGGPALQRWVSRG
jgi:hypothetical protein